MATIQDPVQTAADVTFPPSRGNPVSWQEKLTDYCRSNQLPAPVYQILSDRKGGRTAWSATVLITKPGDHVEQQTVQARYWYDGQHVNNAKEDASEVALRVLMGSPTA